MNCECELPRLENKKIESGKSDIFVYKNLNNKIIIKICVLFLYFVYINCSPSCRSIFVYYVTVVRRQPNQTHDIATFSQDTVLFGKVLHLKMCFLCLSFSKTNS